MTWTVRPGDASPTVARPTALGGTAWTQPVTVAWSLPGETRTATEDIWLTFLDEPTADGAAPATRLAGDSDSPTAAAPGPIWLQQPVRLHRLGAVLVLSAADDAEAWVEQAAAVQQTVSRSVGAAQRVGSEPLVVEVPQSPTVFERILGVRPGSYAAVAAAAWPMGRDSSAAPVHVVVNPAAAGQLSGLGRNVLLAHEAVHVATRSPDSAAPSWLVEGYADQIAYQAYPAGRAPAERSVRAAVREYAIPDAWPAEDDFAPDAEKLDLAYDLAWTAARSIAEAYGNEGLDRFYAAADRGNSIEEAATAIGTTEASLLRNWRADLERLRS